MLAIFLNFMLYYGMEAKTVKELSVFKLAWPLFVQTILSMCMGYADTIMISRCSETAVGAIGNAHQILGFLNLAFSIISSAVGVVVAQYLGAKRTEQMNRIYTVSVLFNLALSVSICFFVTTFSRSLLHAVQIPDVMLEDADSYMKIVGCFLFTDAVVMVFAQILNCHGKTAVGMFLFFGMNVLNIAGNYIFLFGPLSYLNLGVRGVAISTSVNSVIGMIASFAVFKKVIKGSISFRYLHPFPADILAKLIRLGIPTAGENISYNIAQIIITAFVNSMGPEATTAKIYCNTLTLFSLVYSNSMAGATSIIVGHSVGAEDYDFAYRRVMKSLLSAIIVSLSVAVANYLLSPRTLRFFTSDAQIVSIGRKVMFVAVFLEAGRCINLIVIRSMRAAGDVVFPTVLGIVSMWGISVSGAYIFGIVLGYALPGIWLGMAFDEIFRAVVVLIRWKRGTWRGKSVVKKAGRA